MNLRASGISPMACEWGVGGSLKTSARLRVAVIVGSRRLRRDRNLTRRPPQHRPDNAGHRAAIVTACGIAIEAVDDVEGDGVLLPEMHDNGVNRIDGGPYDQRSLGKEVPWDPGGARVASCRARLEPPLRMVLA